MTLCCIDLDHFKYINDTYGHQAGDEALKAIANLLRKNFTEGFITRMGGDEFVVALFNVNDRNVVREQMERVMHDLKEYFRRDDRMRPLSMSIGIAKTENEHADLDMLLHQSDDAMYWSKEQGRNQYTFYDEVLNDIVNYKKRIAQEREKNAE